MAEPALAILACGSASRYYSHPRLHHPQLGALRPSPIGGLPVAYQLSVISDAPQDLAVVVEPDPPHGRLVEIELRQLLGPVGDLARLARRRPLPVRAGLVDLGSDARKRVRERPRASSAAALGGGGLEVLVEFPRSRHVGRRPGLAVVVAGEGRVEAENPHVAVLAGRGNHVVAPVVARSPGYVSDQSLMTGDLDGQVELPRAGRGAERTGDGVPRSEDLDRVHSGDHQTEGISGYTRSQSRVARFRVRVKPDLETSLLSAVWLGAGLEVVDLGVVGNSLGLFAFVDREVSVGSEQGEISISRCLVMFNGERPVRMPA